jgi:hypothetical protein
MAAAARAAAAPSDKDTLEKAVTFLQKREGIDKVVGKGWELRLEQGARLILGWRRA